MRSSHDRLHIQRLGVLLCCAIASQSHAIDPSDAFRTHYAATDMDVMGLAVAALGDLDSDGINDYAISAPGWNYITGRVHAYSGATGSPLMTFTGNSSVSFLGFAVANAGDVNNDGIDDILIGAPTEFVNSISVGCAQIRSGADGSIIHGLNGFIADGCFGWSVAGAGDVDGDGYSDVAIATPYAGPGTVEVFSGNSGSLLRQIVAVIPNGEFGRSIANAGDLNGDGFDDLLIGSPKANRAFIYDAHNDQIIRSFVAFTNSQLGRAVASTGDVNGDGINDVIIGAPADDQAFVYSGDDASLIYAVSGVTGSHFGRSVGSVSDFNGDGTPDFLVGSPSHNGRVEVFSGATGLRLWIASASNDEDFGFAVAGISDITGDGRGEVIVGHPGLLHQGAAGAAHFFSWSPMAFALGNPQSHNVPALNLVALKSCDMNLDGFDDLVLLTSDRLSVYKSTGTGAFNISTNYMIANATAMAIADINIDGRPDVVVTSLVSPRVKVFRNTSLGLVSNGSLGGVSMPVAATMADFNNDGRMDLAVTDKFNSKVRIWSGNAGGTPLLSDYFTFAAAKPVGANPIQIEAVHLNSDGFVDLAILNKDDQSVSILSNKTDGSFALRTPVALEGTPYSMTFADFDADGHQDLAVVVANSSKASIRTGLPGFSFNDPTFYGVGGGARAVFACDLNSDSQLDLITANWAQDDLTVRLGQSNGFAPPIKKNVGWNPSAIVAADLDGDGDLDLATLNKTSRTFSIVPNLMFE